MLDPKTQQHLDTAERNQALAYTLLQSAASMQPSPLEWAAVVAFYSAVHFVNAFCWETHTFEPGSHRGRRIEVGRHFPRAVAASYRSLNDAGWDVRYMPLYTIAPADVSELLDLRLAAVRSAVLLGLGLPT